MLRSPGPEGDRTRLGGPPCQSDQDRAGSATRQGTNAPWTACGTSPPPSPMLNTVTEVAQSGMALRAAARTMLAIWCSTPQILLSLSFGSAMRSPIPNALASAQSACGSQRLPAHRVGRRTERLKKSTCVGAESGSRDHPRAADDRHIVSARASYVPSRSDAKKEEAALSCPYPRRR